MTQKTDSKQIFDNAEHFLEVVKQILKTKCYVKFDTTELEIESSFFEGAFALTSKKRFELLMRLEDITGEMVDTGELREQNIRTVEDLYSYILKKQVNSES